MKSISGKLLWSVRHYFDYHEGSLALSDEEKIFLQFYCIVFAKKEACFNKKYILYNQQSVYFSYVNLKICVKSEY